MTFRSLILTAAAMGSLAAPAASLAQTPAPATAPATPAAAMAVGAFTPITPAAGQDIVAVLTASGQFTTLLKALAATGLTPVLKNPNLTVFAPTDAAFAALPAGQLDGLMKPDSVAAFRSVVLYHVVNAPIGAASAKGHQTKVATAAGGEVWVDGTFDPMRVNDATVLQADVAAGTGHIWVIDKVVTPGFTPPAPGPQAQGVPDPAEATTATTTTSAAKKTTTTTRKKK